MISCPLVFLPACNAYKKVSNMFRDYTPAGLYIRYVCTHVCPGVILTVTDRDGQSCVTRICLRTASRSFVMQLGVPPASVGKDLALTLICSLPTNY